MKQALYFLNYQGCWLTSLAGLQISNTCLKFHVCIWILDISTEPHANSWQTSSKQRLLSRVIWLPNFIITENCQPWVFGEQIHIMKHGTQSLSELGMWRIYWIQLGGYFLQVQSGLWILRALSQLANSQWTEVAAWSSVLYGRSIAWPAAWKLRYRLTTLNIT